MRSSILLGLTLCVAFTITSAFCQSSVSVGAVRRRNRINLAERLVVSLIVRCWFSQLLTDCATSGWGMMSSAGCIM